MHPRASAASPPASRHQRHPEIPVSSEPKHQPLLSNIRLARYLKSQQLYIPFYSNMFRLIFACLCLIYSQKNPWFILETIDDNQRYTTTGEHWFDSTKNRYKVVKANGAYDLFCPTVQPGNIECELLFVGGKMYIIFPQLRRGCFCCDQAHGCGAIRRDWLSGAKYLGTENLHGEVFDKWSIETHAHDFYYYATTDSKQIPRGLHQENAEMFDYLLNTYSTLPIADSVFAIPDYVAGDCPSSSACSEFRGQVPE